MPHVWHQQIQGLKQAIAACEPIYSGFARKNADQDEKAWFEVYYHIGGRMFSVAIDEAMLQKLSNMLQDEDEGTCVRLREYKVGGG